MHRIEITGREFDLFYINEGTTVEATNTREGSGHSVSKFPLEIKIFLVNSVWLD